NFQGLDACRTGDQTTYESTADTRKWQTPPRGAPDYNETYQDYRDLTGFADVSYNPSRTAATITFVTFTREDVKVEYRFGDEDWTTRNTYQVSSSWSGPLTLEARAGKAYLTLDPFYFIWDIPQINRPETNNGQKGAIVELFGWPYNDIAQECTFLGKAGYMGLRIWAPNDYWLEEDQVNPWYWVYQPVSYRLTRTRMGTFEELRNMIVTCRRQGVRVFTDAVVNHMSGGTNDVQPKRVPAGGGCNRFGPRNASAGSPYYTHTYTFKLNPWTGQRPALEYPAVPYGPTDFHCDRSLNSFTSPFILNYGWLVGLADLDTSKEYVQNRIATYLATLLSLGISGFRIDAAKHIRPDDLAAILSRLRTKMGGTFPPEFITWLEIIIGGEKDLLACQISPYNYYEYLNSALASNGISPSDINKIKIWSSDYPKEFPICGRWILPSERFVIQLDDHDQQNDGSSSRDMGDKGTVLVRSKNVPKHRDFSRELFTRTDGNWQIRLVLSSYSYKDNDNTRGFPDGYSDCKRYKGSQTSPCRSMPYSKAFEEGACGYSVLDEGGRWREGVYTRVHRDLGIVRAMRGWMGLSTNVGPGDVGLPSRCT
ncbi:hypothetical protein HK102_007702, partial [Quaeritorhiza haematococci]